MFSRGDGAICAEEEKEEEEEHEEEQEQQMTLLQHYREAGGASVTHHSNSVSLCLRLSYIFHCGFLAAQTEVATWWRSAEAVTPAAEAAVWNSQRSIT